MSHPEKRSPGGNLANADQSTTGDAEILDDAEGVRKLRATLAARLALMGRELHELAGGDFLVTGAGSVAYLGDLGAVKRYAATLGAPR